MAATEGVRKGGLKVRAPAEIPKAPSGRTEDQREAGMRRHQGARSGSLENSEK